ncbi:phosphate signaling complex protein PhoU [Chitinophagaceae bacterium MMS25-I14]
MTQLEKEIKAVKGEVLNMWQLVQKQLLKAKDAMLRFDVDLAREVVAKEKRVNAFELKIDRDCENVFALFTPVAVDLRFLLAAIKINSNMERIGDIAEGIAKYIIQFNHRFDEKILERTKLLEMYDVAIEMLNDTRLAFESENTMLARSVFKQDEILDEINREANENVAACITADINSMNEALYVLSMIRKMERLGDQVKNIAEEIIFYLEAKVLKHQDEV